MVSTQADLTEQNSSFPLEGPPVLILAGPTASGKTALSIELVKRAAKHKGLRFEVINGDSVQVYRHFDIGSAKITPEEQENVPHHLLSCVEPEESFTAGDFFRLCHAKIQEIYARGAQPLIVGGTGFYLKALIFGMWDGPKSDPELRKRFETLSNSELYDQLKRSDPDSAERINLNDRYRLIRANEIFELSGQRPSELATQARMPHPRFRLWVLDRDEQEIKDRIARRSLQMLEQGLLEETRALETRFPGARALSSVGYAQCLAYLHHQAPQGRVIAPGLEGLRTEIELATRQLVKSQRTWFRNQLKTMAQPQGLTASFTLDADHSAVLSAFDSFCDKL